MTLKDLDEYWEHNFSGVLPLADRFRASLNTRWVRFHSLPGSKRYAETQDEYSIILKRYNTILGQLIEGATVFLVTTTYSISPRPKRPTKEFLRLVPGVKHWRTIPLHEIDQDPDCPNYWHLYASELNWQPGVLDPLLKMVADDVVSDLLILSIQGNWLYHPYDGGADVILPSTQQRDELRNQHTDWLSSHPLGL